MDDRASIVAYIERRATGVRRVADGRGVDADRARHVAITLEALASDIRAGLDREDDKRPDPA